MFRLIAEARINNMVALQRQPYLGVEFRLIAEARINNTVALQRQPYLGFESLG
jgi:hypothetical protein